MERWSGKVALVTGASVGIGAAIAADLLNHGVWVVAVARGFDRLQLNMERWSGCVAVVTGASSGIGSLMTADLVQKGVNVVGVARRVEVVEKLADKLKGSKGKLQPIKCDAQDPKDIEKVFEWIEANWGAVHILVNNAAALVLQNLDDCNAEDLKSMFDTNVVGLSLFAKHALSSMKKHQVEEGHIVNINSYVGHHVFGVKGMAPYCATKHAVTVLTEALRRELGPDNRSIKVTSLSPGLVGTDLTSFFNAPDDAPKLRPQDVSDTVMYVLSTPKGLNVTELTVMQTGDVTF